MRTRERPALSSPAEPDRRPIGWARSNAAPLGVVAAIGLALAAFFLALYLVEEYPMPIGWDTPRYLGQAQFVAERGLNGVPEELPPPTKTLDSRAAGFPVVVLTLSALFQASTFKLAAVVPVAAAVALALAAGALVSRVLGRPLREFAAVAVVVGLSPVVVRLLAPETYTDNLFSAALFVSALLPMADVVRGRGGTVAAVALLTLGGLAHPSFLGIMLAILGVTALAYLPGSWRSWRSGDVGLLDTPAVRLAGIGVGAGSLVGAWLYGALGTGVDSPRLTRGELRKKLGQDWPIYLFPVTAPLAAAGAWSLGRAGRSGEAQRGGAGFLLRVSLGWTVVVLAGVVVFLFGRLSPAHRFLAFFLPLPILAALGLLSVSRAAAGRLGAAAGRAVLAVGLVGALAGAYVLLYVTMPARGLAWLEENKVQDAATASAYLDAADVPEDHPVVFVVDDLGPNPLSYVPEMAYILRSILPPDRIEHAYVYVGRPGRYLEGQPTYRRRPVTYQLNVARFWPAVKEILPREPVALVLRGYSPWFENVLAEHPEWEVAPGVAALDGPAPDGDVAAPPIPSGPRTVVQGVVLGAGVLAVLAVLGIGWVAALLPGRLRPYEVLALAPAFGIGFLILGGIAVDALGVRLTGAGGVATLLLTGICGGALGLARARRVPASPA